MTRYFAALERVMSPQIAAGLAVLVGFSRRYGSEERRRISSKGIRVADGSVAAFCTSHLSVVSALVAAFPAVGYRRCRLAVWTISIIPTYYVWHLRALGRPWMVPGWLMLLEYGAIAVAGLVIALRRVMRAPVTHVSHENAAPLR